MGDRRGGLGALPLARGLAERSLMSSIFSSTCIFATVGDDEFDECMAEVACFNMSHVMQSSSQWRDPARLPQGDPESNRIGSELQGEATCRAGLRSGTQKRTP